MSVSLRALQLRSGFLYLLVLSFGFLPAVLAQQVSPELLHGLTWRLIGPYRAGRVSAVAGIAGDPKTYYMGTPGGGVWKTTNAGTTWFPIFDQTRVASIGDLVVAPSNPNIIYVATGEQTDGNGVWKSTDAGSTWSNIGIRDSRFNPSLLVDPKDANVVYVAAPGESVRTAFQTPCDACAKNQAAAAKLASENLPALNKLLAAEKLAAVTYTAPAVAVPACAR